MNRSFIFPGSLLSSLPILCANSTIVLRIIVSSQSSKDTHLHSEESISSDADDSVDELLIQHAVNDAGDGFHLLRLQVWQRLENRARVNLSKKLVAKCSIVFAKMPLRHPMRYLVERG